MKIDKYDLTIINNIITSLSTIADELYSQDSSNEKILELKSGITKLRFTLLNTAKKYFEQ